MINNIPQSLLDAIKKVLSESNSTQEANKIYYRGTDNPDEQDLVTSGKLNPSINHETGKPEVGVSVSDVSSVGKYFKFLYKVSGKELQHLGSDGEPLLDPKSMKFIGWVKSPRLNESIEHPMIEVDGKMKHRHNSLGQPIHHTDEGIKNFHRWFGDSRAVDEHGRPHIFYHGTSSDIQQFHPDFLGHGNDQFGSGFYFADSPHIANQYTSGSFAVKHSDSPNVLPVYLSIKNPINTSDETSLKKDHIKSLIKSAPDHKDALSNFGDVDYEGYDKVLNVAVKSYQSSPKKDAMNYIHNDFYSGHTKEFVSKFKQITGHDGLVDDRNEQRIATVFDPKDIKSAIGNSGTFSTSTNITEKKIDPAFDAYAKMMC